MDYSDFRKELLQDLRSEDPEDLRTSFLESVCSELINFDQILDFVSFHFKLGDMRVGTVGAYVIRIRITVQLRGIKTL